MNEEKQKQGKGKINRVKKKGNKCEVGKTRRNRNDENKANVRKC